MRLHEDESRRGGEYRAKMLTRKLTRSAEISRISDVWDTTSDGNLK
jgi:hypothetical protein